MRKKKPADLNCDIHEEIKYDKSIIDGPQTLTRKNFASYFKTASTERFKQQIHISIPKDIERVLKHDSFLYGFEDSDQSTISKAFIAVIVHNYYQQYIRDVSERDKKIYLEMEKYAQGFKKEEEIRSLYSEYSPSLLNDPDVKNSLFEIIRIFNYENEKRAVIRDKGEVADVFCPVKAETSAELFHLANYIQQRVKGNRYVMPEGSLHISEALAELLTSYTLLPQWQRERIVFADSVRQIESVLNEGEPKVFTFGFTNNKYKRFYVYDFVKSGEDVRNYVIGVLERYNGERVVDSIRLEEIFTISTEPGPEKCFTNDEVKMLEYMKNNYPEYSFGQEGMKEIRVKFSKRGLNLYLHGIQHQRPHGGVKLNEDTYLFKCPTIQAFYYFRSFGAEAYVIEPLSLRKKLMSFHELAYEKYTKEEQ